MEILSITTPQPNWFAVFHFDDGTITYEPVAVWASILTSFGEPKIIGFSQSQDGRELVPCEYDCFFGYHLINEGELKADRWKE